MSTVDNRGVKVAKIISFSSCSNSLNYLSDSWLNNLMGEAICLPWIVLTIN